MTVVLESNFIPKIYFKFKIYCINLLLYNTNNIGSKKKFDGVKINSILIGQSCINTVILYM